MFVKLNDRTYLNKDRITRIKVDSVQDGIRIRFYEGQFQVAKSGRLKAKKKRWSGCRKILSANRCKAHFMTARAACEQIREIAVFVMCSGCSPLISTTIILVVCAFKKSLRKDVAVNLRRTSFGYGA